MTFALPQAYVNRMRQQLGAEAEAYFATLNVPFCRALRLNPIKPVPVQWVDGLLEPVPWQPNNGFYLEQSSKAGAHPLHEAGACYLQEPSAMMPVSVLKPMPGERLLDLCAAPGGKSTQMAEGLKGDGLLVCNEPVPSRARILSRNIERMGIPNALVVSSQPEQLAELWSECFDGVLVDAPCSGEGMFRRQPESRAEWNEQSPAGCAVRQQRIIAAAYRLLRPGGRLVYSTCTFNREENEGVINWLLQEHGDMETVPFSLPVNAGRTLSAPNGMLHAYPHQIKGEGHFIALLHKKGNAPTPAFDPADACLAKPDPALAKAYQAFAAGQELGLPQPNAQLGDCLLTAPPLPPLRGVKVLRAGLQLGVLKGKIFFPDHALAMGLTFPYPFPTVPLTVDQARAYQRGEVIPVADTLRGFVLPTLDGLALGFGKAADGQMKNHYPKGLRRP